MNGLGAVLAEGEAVVGTAVGVVGGTGDAEQDSAEAPDAVEDNAEGIAAADDADDADDDGSGVHVAAHRKQNGSDFLEFLRGLENALILQTHTSYFDLIRSLRWKRNQVETKKMYIEISLVGSERESC